MKIVPPEYLRGISCTHEWPRNSYRLLVQHASAGKLGQGE
jgi:hypothetical protein